MIWIDYAIIGLISISLIIGLVRGLVREAFALVTWGLAFWVGLTFSAPFSDLLKNAVTIESARIAVAFAVLFLLTLIVGAIINHLLSALISKTGLTGTDRLAGLLFGIARGAIIIVILVMLAGLTPLPESSWWAESQLIPHFQALAVWLNTNMPDSIAGYLKYQ
ncbi:MAG: CvpA family protein [Methyloprofundus sp.]|nr:CvpA family protein [Methyloprofundus sp.]